MGVFFSDQTMAAGERAAGAAVQHRDPASPGEPPGSPRPQVPARRRREKRRGARDINNLGQVVGEGQRVL